MIVNQMNGQRELSPKVRSMLDSMYAMLMRKSAELAPVMEEINMGLNQLPRRVSITQSDKQSEKSLRQKLLTPRQSKHCEDIQKLCFQMMKIQEQINVLAVTAELDLPIVQLIELPNYLMKMDGLIQHSKMAAASLGVKTEIMPNVKHAPVQQQGKGSDERVRH